MVPQNNLVVLATSGQQRSVPHLAQRENTAVMGLDLPADLVDAWGWDCGRAKERVQRGGGNSGGERVKSSHRGGYNKEGAGSNCINVLGIRWAESCVEEKDGDFIQLTIHHGIKKAS